jgi:hypothetical protein
MDDGTDDGTDGSASFRPRRPLHIVTSLNPCLMHMCVYLTVHITKLQLQITFPKPLYIPHSPCIHRDPMPNAQVCVFDGTYYKITTTNYISKTSLNTTFCMYPSGPWPLKIFNVCTACDPWDSNIQLTMGKTGEEEGFCWKHNRWFREFENQKS